jgi:hypothetical protein
MLNDQNESSHEFEISEFCEGCEFLKWGAYIAGTSFMETGSGEPFERQVGVFGWWVAGDILPVGQLPLTGEATFVGDAIATVSTNLFSYSYYASNSPTNGWQTYVATGDLEMDWDFRTRSGTLAISNFDVSHFPDGGLNFSGQMCAPGVTSCGTNTPSGNHFGGRLTGQLPANLEVDRELNGFALGSFVRGPDNIGPGRTVPQGVIGNWAVGNDRYMASGIFAGRNSPTH